MSQLQSTTRLLIRSSPQNQKCFLGLFQEAILLLDEWVINVDLSGAVDHFLLVLVEHDVAQVLYIKEFLLLKKLDDLGNIFLFDPNEQESVLHDVRWDPDVWTELFDCNPPIGVSLAASTTVMAALNTVPWRIDQDGLSILNVFAQILSVNKLLLLLRALHYPAQAPLLQLFLTQLCFLDLVLPDHDQIKNTNPIGDQPLLLLHGHVLFHSSCLLEAVEGHWITIIPGIFFTALSEVPYLQLPLITFASLRDLFGDAPGAQLLLAFSLSFFGNRAIILRRLAILTLIPLIVPTGLKSLTTSNWIIIRLVVITPLKRISFSLHKAVFEEFVESLILSPSRSRLLRRHILILVPQSRVPLIRPPWRRLPNGAFTWFTGLASTLF